MKKLFLLTVLVAFIFKKIRPFSQCSSSTYLSVNEVTVSSYNQLKCAIQYSVTNIYINSSIEMVNQITIVNAKDMIISGISNPLIYSTISRAFNISTSTLTFKNLEFVGSSSGKTIDYGGLLYMDSSNVLLSNITMKNSIAAYNGGALFALSCNLTVLDSLFNNNSVLTPLSSSNTVIEYGGGAIMITNSSYFKSQNTKYLHNYGRVGGAVCVLNVIEVDISNSNFNYNNALSGYGGALSLTYITSGVISESYFRYNKALYLGGAISIHNTTNPFLITKSVVSNNSVSGTESTGGGLSIVNSITMLLSTTISNNIAEIGGGVFVQSAQLIANNSNINNNYADISAGAIECVSNCSVSITLSNIYDNVGHLRAGGIDVDNYCSLHSYNSSFSNNKCTAAESYGGAISCTAGIVNLYSVLLSGSQAYSSSHIYSEDCLLTISYSEISNGKSDTSYGIYATANTKLLITSSKMSSNYASLTGSVLGCVGTIQCKVISSTLDYNEVGNTGQILINAASGYFEKCIFESNLAYSGGVFGVLSDGILVITESTFTSNKASNNGGVAVLQLGSITVSSSVFYSNEGTVGGCISITDGYATIVNSNFTGNTAYQEGGVISLDSESQLIMNSSNVISSYSPFGGVISGQANVKVIMDSVVAEYNAAPYGGGVIALFYDVLVIMTNCKFNYNTATIGGVILGQYNIHVDLSDCAFNNNYATDFGGAVFLQVRVLLSSVQSSFFYNTASYQGGAIAINTGLANISYSLFEGNSAEEGGTLYLINTPAIKLDSCTFTSNGNDNVVNGGVASIESYSTITSINTTYVNNTALSGGVFFLSKSSFYSYNDKAIGNNGHKGGFIYGTLTSNISLSLFKASNNRALYSYGAVLYNEDGYCIVNNSILSNNIGPYGAITISRVYTHIFDSKFYNNVAENNGGAIYLISISKLQDLDILAEGFYAHIHNNLFYNNTGLVFGGAIAIYNFLGYVLLDNNSYVDNYSGYGGAIWTTQTNTSILNSEFYNNTALQGGGAIFWTYSIVTKFVVPIINCKESNNTAGYGDYVATNVVYLNAKSFLPYIVSGATLVQSINVYLNDYYEQIVTNTSESFPSGTFVFATLSNSTFVIRGSTVVEASNGVAIFSSLIISGTPGSNVTVDFQLSGSNVVLSTSISLYVQNCVAGQITQYQSPGVSICQNCLLGTYSLSPSQTTCQLCPENANCPGLNVIDVNQGYWRLSLDSTEVYIYECPYILACNGGNNTNTQCAVGHTGPLCNICDSGYARNSDGSCTICSNQLYVETIVLTPTISVVAILIIMSFYIFRRLIHDAFVYITAFISHVEQFKFRTIRVKFKILVSFYQIVSAMGPSFGISYGSSYTKFLNIFGFLNFNFFNIVGIQCLYTPSFYVQVLFYTIFPIVLFIMIAIILHIKAFIANRMNERNPSYTYKKALDHLIGVALYVSYIALIPVSTKLFELYSCTSLPNGETYLLVDYSVSCSTPIYSKMIIYGAFMLLFYTFGIPLVYTILLVWNHKKVNPNWRLVIEGSEKKFINEKVIQRGKLKVRRTYKEIKNISFLFDNYKPKRWYFEIWDCARRLALGAIPILILRGSPMQIIIILLVSLASIAALMDSEPYIHKRDNTLAIVAQWSITISLIGALVIRVNAADQGTNPTYISILLIIINAVVFTLGVLTAVISAKGNDNVGVSKGDIEDDDEEDEDSESEGNDEEKDDKENKEENVNIESRNNDSTGDVELAVVNPIATIRNKHFVDDKYYRKSYNQNDEERDSDDEF